MNPFGWIITGLVVTAGVVLIWVFTKVYPCPECQSWDIEDIEENGAVTAHRCNACRHSWRKA